MLGDNGLVISGYEFLKEKGCEKNVNMKKLPYNLAKIVNRLIRRKEEYNWKNKILYPFLDTGYKIVNNRLYDNGNILKYNHPELIEEWDFSKNNKIGIQPDKISRFSQEKVHWKGKCEHKWFDSIYSRTYDHKGCPECLIEESRIASDIMGEIGLYPKSVITVYNCYHNSNIAKCDAVDSENKIVVEYDGYYWHRNKTSIDIRKTLALIATGYKVIRIREKSLLSLKNAINNDNYYEINDFSPYGNNRNKEIIKIVTKIREKHHHETIRHDSGNYLPHFC